MAKRKVEEIIAAAGKLLEGRDDDDAIAFLEDLADSFTIESDDWKLKYEENDKKWREKYMKRFMKADPGSNTLDPDPPTGEESTDIESVDKSPNEVMQEIFQTEEDLLSDIEGVD